MFYDTHIAAFMASNAQVIIFEWAYFVLQSLCLGILLEISP